MCFPPPGSDRAHSRRQALLIALQYDTRVHSDVKALRTPYRDVGLLKDYLTKEKYSEENIVVMKDSDDVDPSLWPTRQNIVRLRI